MNDPAVLIPFFTMVSAIVGYLALRYSPKKAKPVSAVLIPAPGTTPVDTTFANIVISAMQAELAALREMRVIDEEDHRLCATALTATQKELTRMYRKYGNGNGSPLA